ncbi:tRNA guanosine(15) transglycosylase TgtA [Methanobrevibacter curvatus]|uniref:tRNA-guanine(15) transglycosylase n=1 Tax=Methanobrevibacter curvatus TaxID=49547 RepID=A0A166EBJ4_9EURY|nr:tRNA guanosine(15) transglycosylase TgtA [Methanobrevibacter curvatus]KZX16478.1 queuine tRNA-ribosyltransferase [Methanobrevibacter curvatus]
MFQIKFKDGMGRVGKLETKHGTITTPALMPVIHPRKQTIDVKELGAEIVITNAYLIYKDEDIKKKAIEEGVHNLINFPGPVMTDSGSFQLSVYGDVEIGNKEVIEFQELIKSDIGTSLDIPTAPYVSKEKAEEDLKITLERAKEAKKFRDDNGFELLLNSVVQGSTFPDLRSYCASELAYLGSDLYPIGAVVPLMEMYHYDQIVDIVMSSVSHLPDSKPRHLMGAGHPMLFALAVAMGCDLFDSAAYVLYAEDDRFLSPRGTYKLENLLEMPCSCEICSNYTIDDLKSMEKSERSQLIAKHNLYVSLAEIKLIRQAIYEGSFLELVEERCRVHPNLLNAYRRFSHYNDEIELYDPRSKKSAFFYTGSESINRPEIKRHLNKLRTFKKKKNLVLLPSFKKPYSKNVPNNLGDFYIYGEENKINLKNTDFMVVDIPFCLIPLDLDEIYPLSQNEYPKTKDLAAVNEIEKILSEFIPQYKQILIHNKLAKEYNLNLYRIYPDSNLIKYEKNDVNKIIAIADYQFGFGAGEALFNGKIKIEKSKKTGKIRHIYCDGELIANMRASDSFFILSKEGAKRLHTSFKSPCLRVIVNSDSEPFAREGKSVFSKFIVDCDENIRSNDEVLIVNENDQLLAYGKALLCYSEMMDFKVGQAIKTRKGFKEEI